MTDFLRLPDPVVAALQGRVLQLEAELTHARNQLRMADIPSSYAAVSELKAEPSLGEEKVMMRFGAAFNVKRHPQTGQLHVLGFSELGGGQFQYSYYTQDPKLLTPGEAYPLFTDLHWRVVRHMQDEYAQTLAARKPGDPFA